MEYTTSLRVFFYTALTATLAILARVYYYHQRIKDLPRVGTSPGLLGLRTGAARADFVKHGRKYIEEGCDMQAAFIVQTADIERIVLPPKYLEELRAFPDGKLSHRLSIVDRHLGQYTRLDTVANSQLHRDVSAVQLSSQLEKILGAMKEELDYGMGQRLDACDATSFTGYNTYKLSLELLTRVTCRVLVGLPLCRHQDWLKMAMAYSGDVTNLSASLRSFPPLLRPLVHPFLKATRVLSGDFDVARNHLFPMIANRRSSSEKEKPLDILQWLLDGAKGQDAEPEQIMLKCVFFLLASVHTTTMSTVHALFDLCSMPEQIGILRCEIEEALAIEKGWTMRTLHRLRKMDSFIKESQRMNPMGLVSFNRRIREDITLSDGTFLPSGLLLGVAADVLIRDPARYPEPEIFKPLRFFDENSSCPEEGNKVAFTSLQGSLAFGYGRQACPGRFFASAQIKLFLAHLIRDHDIRYPEGQSTRPPNTFRDERVIPNAQQEIFLKKR